MPEIKPDLSDRSRCVSVHWSLPVQCVLPCTHRENWHEAWDPGTGNRLRYRRSFGIFRTEELRNDEWTALYIPPPGEICGDHQPLTDEQLAEIEQRANAATPGPWTPSDRYPHIAWQGKEIDDDCEFIISTTLSERPAEDIRFIAHAREDVPALLAEVKRLRADRDRAREIAVALEQENARLREHIAFVLDAARERDKEMLHLRDTHKASKRTQTRGHAWEEAAYEVRKIAELLERVDSPT